VAVFDVVACVRRYNKQATYCKQSQFHHLYRVPVKKSIYWQRFCYLI